MSRTILIADRQRKKEKDMSNDAIGIFREKFTMLEANTPHLRKRVHQVRFDVFGREKQWEKSNHTYDERDEYDSVARHCLLTERKEGIDIGTVRVVIPGVASPNRFAMPIQAHTPDGLLHYPEIVAVACEASRFCIVENYRRRLGEMAHDTGVTGAQPQPARGNERRVLPFAPLALIQFIIRCALEERRPVVTALMEPFLIGMLSRLGFEFQPIAHAVEFRGTRYPCILHNLLSTLKHMRTTKPLVWQVVTDGGVLHELALDTIPSVVDNTLIRLIEKSAEEYRAVV